MDMNDVTRFLAPDEPDYEAAVTVLGPAALPLLHELVNGPDVMMASKATYLAGLIGGGDATEVVQTAASHDQPIVRIAAASTVGMIEADVALELAEQLWDDDAPGIRAVIARAATTMPSATSRRRIRDLATADPDESISKLGTLIPDVTA